MLIEINIYFCDRNLLSHLNRQRIFWFCADCRQPKLFQP